MISMLTGILVQKSPNHCTVDVGGVGYNVHTSLSTYSTLPEINEKVSLAIHTYVREDQLQLFGFFTSDEKLIFQRLISISGIGPKLAMSILSGLPPHALTRAIESGDSARLSSIPGIGKKTAARIVIELRDRIGKDLASVSSAAGEHPSSIKEDAISALVNLGYRRPEAERVIFAIADIDKMRIEDAIRKALQELNRV
ncbi:MAG TPA: Holliday junction branch migration protein RuvA [bacterium]|nr:Holliday junction branch migration protein RuvA [Myxococcales bacterium]OQA61898.1 MAG: Holliday junction ATP-dependent DNA helicase RuvA [bacterium ADurb.Bin270]HPW45594.1 Holliday junction branch migration protein RuvA [bacterium]HQC51093.1 Holliday junction branch migration protein RuvA [bacterium]